MCRLHSYDNQCLELVEGKQLHLVPEWLQLEAVNGVYDVRTQQVPEVTTQDTSKSVEALITTTRFQAGFAPRHQYGNRTETDTHINAT
jgi:hypothetical protein